MSLSGIINKLPTKLQSISGKKGRGEKSADSRTKNNESGNKFPALNTLINLLGKYSYDHENMLGVEISPHYIRVCQMKNSYGMWHLNHLASTCMESQFINNDIHSSPELYAENLKQLIEKHNIKTKNVALSVPTSSSIVKVVNMPDMEEEDLAQASSMGAIWENMVQLNGSINDYSIYYKVLQRKVRPSMSLAFTENYSEEQYEEIPHATQSYETPAITQPAEITPDYYINALPANVASQTEETVIDVPSITIQDSEASPADELEEANTMDVLFIASHLSDIQLYTDIAQKAGLNPLVIDIKCNAIKRAFETNPEKHNITQPYALLEFGADENYVYIVEGQSIVTFGIEIAEEDKQLMVNYKEHEDALSDLIQRYAGQLEQILEHYSKNHKRKLKVYNIYVNSAAPLHVDDASSEPIINIFISRMSELLISYKFSPSIFCNHIEVPAEFTSKVNAEGNLSAWATVLGLATCKLDAFDYKKDTDAINRVNLFPAAPFIKKNQVTQVLSTIAMAAIFVFVMFISGSSFLVLSASGSQLTSEIKILEPVKGEYATKNENLQKLTLTMEKIKSLDGVKSSLPSNQSQILLAYKELTKSIPEGVWLSEISFKPPSSLDIKGNSINDQKILEFVNNLNSSSGFKKISLKTMEAIEKAEKDKLNAGPAIKKFMLQGDFQDSSGIEKLELISGGVK